MFLLGKNLLGGYTSKDILCGCTIGVERGEIAVIVGANGAGKSTAMKALLGLLPLRSGEVTLDGDVITHLSPQARVGVGIGFVPQTDNVFRGMSVSENLEMGAFIRTDNITDTLSDIYNLFPILAEKRGQYAGELSGGQRQQLAIARALMMRPKILMLDEPTAGVSPVVMDEIFDCIIDIKQMGVAILMVEQNARHALEIADRGYVLVQGENSYTDTGSNLLSNPDVRRSFMGLSDD